MPYASRKRHWGCSDDDPNGSASSYTLSAEQSSDPVSTSSSGSDIDPCDDRRKRMRDFCIIEEIDDGAEADTETYDSEDRRRLMFLKRKLDVSPSSRTVSSPMNPRNSGSSKVTNKTVVDQSRFERPSSAAVPVRRAQDLVK